LLIIFFHIDLEKVLTADFLLELPLPFDVQDLLDLLEQLLELPELFEEQVESQSLSVSSCPEHLHLRPPPPLGEHERERLLPRLSRLSLYTCTLPRPS